MNAKRIFYVLILIGLVAWFFTSFFWGMTDPDSVFCTYKIYKQPNGTYQVWSSGRSNIKVFEGATYEGAKAYQVERCRSLREFMHGAPHGKRVR